MCRETRRGRLPPHSLTWREHHERIDVQLCQVSFKVHGEVRHAHKGILERLEVRRSPSTKALEQPGSFDVGDHRLCFRARDRAASQGHIVVDLGHHAATTEQEHRAQLLSPSAVLPRSHASVIGYFATISSARLKALSTACSGVIPLFMTSSMAMLKTCSESTCAIAGLNA